MTDTQNHQLFNMTAEQVSASMQKHIGAMPSEIVNTPPEYPDRIKETWRADAGWQRADEAEAKLEELREALNDPVRVHASILSGAIKLTREQALHIGGYYADGFQEDAEPTEPYSPRVPTGYTLMVYGCEDGSMTVSLNHASPRKRNRHPKRAKCANMIEVEKFLSDNT